MKRYKLFVPGPVNTAEGMEKIGYFRDDDFANLVLENEQLLLKAIGSKNGKVIPYTCSGSGAMDAIVTNLISDSDNVLIVDGGTFGHRWVDICNFYKKNFVHYPVSFGKDIDIDDLKETIESKEITLILIQHHETSSGQLFDIKKIGEITKKRNITLVADCVSSFITDPFNMDEFGVDVAITASQKGLRLDSGMSFVILNEKAIDHSKKVKKLNYYNNFDIYLDHYNLGRGHAPFTPSVRTIYQINKRLKKLDIKKEINSINKIANTFREDIKDLPLKIIAQTPSNFLTGLLLYDKYNTSDLYSYLKKKNILICPITNIERYLKNSSKTYFKIAHIGCDVKEHKELIKELRRFFENGRNKN